MQIPRALRAWAFSPVDGGSLAAFRVSFAALMSLALVRTYAKGWLETLYVAPRVQLPYGGFEWVVRPPAPWLEVIFAGLVLAAVLIAVRRVARVAAAVFFVGFTYLELLDASLYLNHYYLVSLLAFMLTCVPVSRAGENIPFWPVAWLRLQLATVYFFAGVAKLDTDWLVRAEPLTIWLSMRTDVPLLGPALAWPETAYVMAWSGMAFDLTIGGFLLWKRTRLAAYGVVVVFHAMTGVLFPIGVFPWVMIALTPIFLAPDWPTQLYRRLRRPGSARIAEGIDPWPPRNPAAVTPVTGTPAHTASPTTQLRVLLAASAFSLVQVLLPLRTFLYPGDPLWTEEGFRLTWRVMLMEKTGLVELHVRDATGRSFVVHPEAELTPVQRRAVSTQPDVLLSYVHQVAARLRAQGVPAAEIRVEAFVSLNGRPEARWIDPNVDLARETHSLRPKPWILPSPREP